MKGRGRQTVWFGMLNSKERAEGREGRRGGCDVREGK